MDSIMKHYNQHLKNASCNIDIPNSLLVEWQSVVELIADIGDARAGLIMRVQEEEIEVFVSSKQIHNPYQVGSKEPLINSGLYCEAVVKDDEMLYVPNALKTTAWNDNPDLKYGLLCYLGLPIKLPNGQPFGTICILDDKENNYSSNIIKLMEKMRDLIESHLKLLYISFHDALTNTYNRTFFNLKVEKEMQQAKQNEQPLTMLLFDLDRFKQINDVFGHLVGDQVLKAFAKMMQDIIQEPQIAVRYGGEEFIVLMPNTNIDEAASAAEKIRATVEKSRMIEDYEVTVSVGVAGWIYEESFEEWYKRADEALYYVKKHGRNQVAIYTEALNPV